MKSILIAAAALAAIAATAYAADAPAPAMPAAMPGMAMPPAPPAGAPGAPGAPGGAPGAPGGRAAPAPFDPANPLAACARCHTGMEGSRGPNLKGVFGRDIASFPGFTYSEPLKAKEGNWDEAKLDSFLKNSQADTPGTGMRQMVPDANRSVIITFLKTYK